MVMIIIIIIVYIARLMAPKRVGRPASHSGRRPPHVSTIARAAALAATALAEAESRRLTLMDAMADGERERVALSNEIEQLKLQNEELRSRAEAAEAQLEALAGR